MADIKQIKVGSTTYDIRDTSKLEKTSYEWNKEASFGSSGYLKIGSFGMYDSNVTIDIDSTTSTTYHATVVIATQNVSETSIGSAHVVNVYGDASDTITPNIRVVWTSGSRNYDVYFVPASWSKNLIHIKALGIYSYSDICISQSGTAPSSTSGLEAVNKLTSTYSKIGSSTSSDGSHSHTITKTTDTIHDYNISLENNCLTIESISNKTVVTGINASTGSDGSHSHTQK